LWEKDLTVDLAFGQPYVYAGECASIKEKIENHKRMPVSPLEVRFRIRKGIQFQDTDNTSVSDFVYKRDIYALLGRQRITRTLQMECQKRGLYAIEDVSMVTYSLLHEDTYRKNIDTDESIYVYAKRTNVDDVLRAGENLMGAQESDKKYLEDPFAFASIRDYTMQDPMKNINWKASAKTGDLMVNTFTSMKNEKMMIYLDVEDNGVLKKEHLVEDSISVAATLFQKLMSKGMEVGIAINLRDEDRKSFFYLPLSRSKSNRILLEQTLATNWKDNAVTDFDKVLEVPFKDAIPVIISKNIMPQRMQKAESLIGNNSKGIWVLPHEYGEVPAVYSDRFLFVKREVAE
jgi:uncharacterized protein (DUF58 family)